MLKRFLNTLRQRNVRFLLATALSLALVVLASVARLDSLALAQDSAAVTDDQVNEVAKQLYCPVCENIPLDVCPTQACAQWRDLIRLKLSEGWSTEQIKSYFADQYGERVLATPRAEGFNWFLIPVPALAFAAGAFILYRALKSLARPQHSTSTEVASEGQDIVVPQAGKTTLPANTQDDYIKRVEEELRKR